MTYEEAKAYYEPIAVYVANIVSEVTPPEIEVHTEWNGANDILVDFYKFQVSVTAMIPVEVAEDNDDDAILEIVAKQLREFDGREYLKEMKSTKSMISRSLAVFGAQPANSMRSATGCDQ